MSTEIESKINRLLSSQPSGVVLSSAWLRDQGYSLDLQKRYKKSRWFESIGTGALVRTGEDVDYLGGIYALQLQLGRSVHPGAKTALSLLGKAHYLELSTQKVTLFGAPGEGLPLWFKNRDWGLVLDYHRSGFLPPDLGVVEFEHKGFSIKISGAARAILECIVLAPEKQSLLECFELMEGLNNLRPSLVQSLLERCGSIKAKRVFLYLAEKAGHDWFNYLDLKKIALGKGKRSVVKKGAYVSKYQITVPKELEA